VHFATLGFPLPAKTNPSDFFMDVVTLDQRSESLRETSMKRIKLFHDAWETKQKGEVDSKVERTVNVPSATDVRESSQWPSTWSGEFRTLLHRNMLDVSRDFRATVAFLAQGFVLMVSGLGGGGVWDGVPPVELKS
jgi:hypothetical protein